MKLVIALGNPGKKYEQTRHNVGWLALDYILDRLQFSGPEAKFNSLVKEVRTESGDKILFVYPQTFMNDSGQAVNEFLNFFKVSPKELLVLHDEIDLPLGTFRWTKNSSSAGHNGVQSIIDALGTQEFSRVRIGIEARADKKIPSTQDYVLQEFNPGELEKIPFKEIQESALAELKIK